jgi:hypothetical protein
MPQAKAEPTDARHAAMATVGAAVIKMHEPAMRDGPTWFWHLLKRCEAKAERIAEHSAQGQYACGDATFIEAYAKTLPTLFTQTLERLDSRANALADTPNPVDQPATIAPIVRPTSERDEIRKRVDNFKAHQDKIARDRENYYLQVRAKKMLAPVDPNPALVHPRKNRPA